MSIDSLATWKTTFEALPKVTTAIWSTNFSDWVDARVTNKAQVNGVTHNSPPFTFNKAVFQAQLATLVVSLDKTTAVALFASCWETAINASTLTTLPGDFVNPGGAPNLIWSVVNSSIIDAASITAAKAQMISDLLSAGDEILASNSQLPTILRDAFLNLTCTITGLDSSTPTPLALNVNGASLI